ncbi:MAG: response regulator [Curvibacter sp.]|nr:response regulator [Curvibacter sp.]
MQSSVPSNDPGARQEALRKSGLLNSPAEERFDRLTRLACQLLQTPMAGVVLFDGLRPWFKSSQGLPEGLRCGEDSFCLEAIQGPGLFEVEDALADERFARSAVVDVEGGVRFYAGAPLSTPEGLRLGTLCIMDRQPRRLEPAQRQALRDLADCVEQEINREAQEDQTAKLLAARRLSQVLLETQSLFIEYGDRTRIFEGLLSELLHLTDSEVGFLGEVLHLGDDMPSLQIEAIQQVGDGAAVEAQPADLKNLQRLFEAALESGQPVFYDARQPQPAATALSWGGTDLSAFLSLPIHHRGRLVALLGVGRRHSTYSEPDVDFLRPLLVTIGQLIEATHVQSENRRIQAELSRLSRVASETTNAVIITNARGEVDWVNPGFTRITGYELDEVRGLRPGGLLQGPATDARTIQDMREALAREGAFRVDVLNYAKSGRPYWVNVSCNEMRNAEGVLQGFMAIETDVTDRKADEQALIQARLEAEEANRSKSEFLANMSHEIRTPMNAMLGLSYLLKQTPLDRKQLEFVDKIQHSGQHLLGIINDILDFSKVEAGKLDVERIEMDLEKVLENVANLVGEKARAKNLDLLFDVAPDVPTQLVGDPLRLGQILINYANNAVKFTDSGEVVIQVRKESESANEVALRLGVRDTGIGLSEEQSRKLFQSFQQADSSTTRKYGGTGLGLAISKRLAALMGGEVGLESHPGQGSFFWFTTRLGKAAHQRMVLRPDPDLRGRRMLVVDDNQRAREILAQLLRQLSFEVEVCASGEEALHQIQQADDARRPYALVFLDWRMPGLDGLAVAGQLAQRVLREPPRSLLVSADTRAELRAEAQQAGMAGLLPKPANPSVLFDCVMLALGDPSKRRRRLALESASPPMVAEAPDQGGSLAGLRGARVLVVEDNDLNQEVAAGLLRHAGLLVDLADNGEIALNRLRDNPYDIVLMDMQMPVMDGLSCTREIRKVDAWRQLPVVAMTANARTSDREQCLAAGMVDFIAKPIEPEELWQVLTRWLSPRRGAAAGQDDAGAVVAQLSLDAAVLQIPGLDIGQGLRRAIGNIPLYLSLLRKFMQEQREIPALIEEAMEVQDWPRAELLAHTLKGVAGNIGAHEVQLAASRLEAALGESAQHPTARAMLSPLSSHLQALIHSIEGQLSPQAVGAAPNPPGPEPAPASAAVVAPAGRGAEAAPDGAGEKALVLVVDDTPENLSLMNAVLKDHYKIKVANKGQRALQIAQTLPLPDIILLDVMMPEMDGYEVCRRLKADPRTEAIPVLFLTAKTDAESEAIGFECGAVDYIPKPISPPVVLARVQAQLQLKRMADFLRNQNDFLENEVQLRTRELSGLQDVTILAMSSMAETRDNETGNHILRTQRYVRCLAKELQARGRHPELLTDAYIEQLYKSAPLHDIGKVGIPDHILLKPGKLTPEEFEVMKTHTVIGYKAIERAERALGTHLEFLKPAKEIALYHQEKWDGSGYPEGLIGEAIPLSARLMAVADVYDALISQRVYKGAMSHDEAMVILRKGRGSHFDPEVFDTFLAVEEDFKEIARSLSDAPSSGAH